MLSIGKRLENGHYSVIVKRSTVTLEPTMEMFCFVLTIGLGFPFMALGDSKEMSQLLWVKASEKPASVAQMLQREKGKWVKVGKEFPVMIGRNGTTTDKHEGDGKTPEGTFPLTQTFGKAARTDVKLNYVQIQPEDKWIDDPRHMDYNKWIRGNTTAKSFETLLRKDHQYDLFAVVGYNTSPIVPGRGSAIFVHVWEAPTRGTAGCVAMETSQMEAFSKWLDPAQNPHIQIGGQF